ncbi:bacteriocin-protection protein [Leptospira wolffii]|uniref:YdeI/OmpD-associated family protein n=1 Tax=Leptospira wolffii TaxID=409998 RepID=UPI001082644E|nr:YdeI/OmpD-associated family protein [Leptospira wolffii]TGK62457.1 bacteriocin-protection protein [Leptospira wolffii]TGK66000.1 bacteriocin-protection protein [Leptospira wolffii]TGK74158.1 bacteriocin-protection protein [Leptospira wolffii]TGL29017.1 bacteriocin-protection protein [Leptospira wolffii]
MDPIFFKSQKEFRSWLKKNHHKEFELILGFYKTKFARKGIAYKEAVDEALCFGWIDGVRKGIGVETYCIRFTPRKSNSIWSKVNRNRMLELQQLGLVMEAGLKAFQEIKKTNQYSFEQESIVMPPAYEKTFRKNKKAWSFFQSQAPYYRRTAIWWVISPKKEETKLSRLSVLISDSEKEKRIDALTWKKKT